MAFTGSIFAVNQERGQGVDHGKCGREPDADDAEGGEGEQVAAEDVQEDVE